MLTKDVIKPENVESQEISSLNIASCLKPQDVLSQLKYLRPVVVLKPIVLPKDVYRCEKRDTGCTSVPELVEDEQQHEEQNSPDSSLANSPEPGPEPVSRVELSYPCNMCDRSFTAIHHLKRHKILHLKDTRKCLRCGVLFCRRHNHFFFQSAPCIQKTQTEDEDESSGSEEQNLNSNLNPEKMEPSQITKPVDNTPPPSAALTDKPPDPKVLPKLPHKIPFLNTHGLMSVRPSPVPPRPTPIFTFLRDTVASFHLQSPVLGYPAVVVHPQLPNHSELPPTLKLFSPQYLTSALLDVQRNYQLILSKVPTSSNKVVAKEEEKPVVICPVEQPVKKTKKEKIAYDLEIIL